MLTRSPHDKDKRICKLYPTDRALLVNNEVQLVCEKTEALLFQGITKTDQELFMNLLVQARRVQRNSL